MENYGTIRNDPMIEASREVLPNFILLKEGENVEVDTKCSTPPESITTRIQITEPVYK